MQDNLAVADVFLFYVDDFEYIENAFGENNASECLVCERFVGVFILNDVPLHHDI